MTIETNNHGAIAISADNVPCYLILSPSVLKYDHCARFRLLYRINLIDCLWLGIISCNYLPLLTFLYISIYDRE